MTHPQRALDTDAQSWYTWVVLDFPLSVDRGKEVLQKKKTQVDTLTKLYIYHVLMVVQNETDSQVPEKVE